MSLTERQLRDACAELIDLLAGKPTPLGASERAAAAIKASKAADKKREQQVTATVYCPGDRSVGIPSSTTEILLPIRWKDFNSDMDYRSAVRDGLRDFATDMHDQECIIRFGDECPDCGQKMKQAKGKRVCSRKHCISNRPESDC